MSNKSNVSIAYSLSQVLFSFFSYIELILLSTPFITENPDYRSYQVKLDLLQFYISPKTHGLWKQKQKQNDHPDKNMFLFILAFMMEKSDGFAPSVVP